MNKEQFAAMLNGREIGSEITEQESKLAEENGLVVVFGYSDDNIEFRGVIYDEIGACDSGTLHLYRTGILDDPGQEDCRKCRERLTEQQELCAELRALWCEEGDYSWTFKTAIPHATFEVLEEGGPFCRGIVFEAASLPTI